MIRRAVARTTHTATAARPMRRRRLDRGVASGNDTRDGCRGGGTVSGVKTWYVSRLDSPPATPGDACGIDTAGANAFGVDAAGIDGGGGGASGAGIGGGGAIDAGIGSEDGAPCARTGPPTTATGAGVRSGLSGGAIGSVDGMRIVAGGAYGSKTGESDGADGATEGADRGAEGATDGADRGAGGAAEGADRGGADGVATDDARGAIGAMPERGGIEPAFGASLMRVVAGATLAGALLTGAAVLTGALFAGALLAGARSFTSSASA
jgi:hypothetical protein